MTEEIKANLKCMNCGKETTPWSNFCDWPCQIELAKKNGGKVHTPNGLPIRCIRWDNLMTEIEGGDHPDYKFPVDVEYLGTKLFESPANELAMYGRQLKDDEERRWCLGEEHALLYTDGSIAVTFYECSYAMWHLEKGDLIGGRHHKEGSFMKDGEFHPGDWKLSEESRLKILAYKRPEVA